MKKNSIVQALSIAVIALVVASSPTVAQTEDFDICTACVTGLGTQCPTQEELDDWCHGSCGMTLGGCASAWGNCQDGYRIGCNLPE